MAEPWTAYDGDLWHRQPLPPERRPVLVRLAPRDEHLPVAVAVGWLKFAAGDPKSPYFVTPGVPGEVTHWLDCLDKAAFEFFNWSMIEAHR